MTDDIRIDHNNEGVYPPDDFTGLWEVYWPIRKLKFRGRFVNGQPHGRQTCWWDNGRLAQTGVSEYGRCGGVWPDYLSDGTKTSKTEYVDSDNFVITRYGLDGQIEAQERFTNGVWQHLVNGTWEDGTGDEDE